MCTFLTQNIEDVNIQIHSMSAPVRPMTALFYSSMAEILPEMIEWGPLYTADIFKSKSVADFNQKWNTFQSCLIFSCLFSRLLRYFLKNYFFLLNVKKNTQKVAYSWVFFLCTPQVVLYSPFWPLTILRHKLQSQNHINGYY